MKKSYLLKSFAILTGGVALTQLIVVISSPILTRLYSPESFGLLSTYMSIVSIISVVSSFRYELAIPASQHEVQTENLFFLNIFLILFNFFILGIITILFGDWLLRKSGLAELIGYKFLIPFGFLFLSVFRVTMLFAVKQKRYKDVAKTKISQSLGMVFVQIAFYKFGTIALLLGHIVGQSLGVKKLLFDNEVFLKKKRNIVSRKKMFAMAKKYKNFPKYSMWSALMNTAGQQMPIILLTSLFSPAIAGFYALGQRLIFLPVTLITGSIVSMLFGEGAALKKNNQLGGKIWNLHKMLSLLTLPFVLPAALLLPELFKFAFGTQWQMAGEFSVILMPWFYFVFTLVPVFDTFEAYYNQKIMISFQFFLSVGRIGAIFLGYMQHSVYYALVYFSAVSVICFLVFFCIILSRISIDVFEVAKFYFLLFGIALIVYIPLFLYMVPDFLDPVIVKSLTVVPAVIIAMCFSRKYLKLFV